MVVTHSRSIDFFGNEFCDRSRTIHRREYSDVVPRAGFSVGPKIPFECRPQLRRKKLIVLRAFGKPVFAREIAQPHVMLMHPVTGRNLPRCESDRLSVLPYRFALLNGRYRHLVAAQDALARGYARGNNAGCDLING